ncbi:hypothetical protein Fmac_011816 [Flemingia macrophylla]|uniref:Disease resistance protein At4g27190-like leucine-rich repeats domain-containing protein n=1 Tax=Flemingia macrophylla TaxID=520843 RepID=A0ABD1MQL6_9FABA
MKKLTEIWHHTFPLHSFGELDALIIEGCNKLVNVFPSFTVRRFKSLCNLKVTNCKSMKEIFDLKGCGKCDADMTNLQNVHVQALPKLKHILNKDPEGRLHIKRLKKIRVQECLFLEHIFPVSVARDLKNLEYLEVLNCGQLKEIVSMEEKINVESLLFEFPRLITATFSKLPNLESFYGKTCELRCSALNNLSVELCHKLKLFKDANANPEIGNTEIKPVFLPEKVLIIILASMPFSN